MNAEVDGKTPARRRSGLEPFQNELGQSSRFPDLGFFVIRAAYANANVAGPLQHVEAAGRSTCPESLLTEIGNFPGRHLLLASRGFAFLELLWRKHLFPSLLRVGRAWLTALLRELQADGINEGGQREKTLRGGQLPFRRWRGLRTFDRFTLDRFYLVTRQQRARIHGSLGG